jgi:hypothetical protein
MTKKIILCALALAVTAGAAHAKETVAVYVTGGKEEGANDMLSASLKEAITKSSSYVAVERTASFLQQLRREQRYQQSGNVNDSDIARLGLQSGAQYVCVAEIMPVAGGDFVTARLIGVESASVVATADGADKITTLEALMRVSEGIAAQLLQDAAQSRQGKPKARVAVYVTGSDDDEATGKILGIKLVSAITKSARYAAMERTAAFLQQLRREQDYQASGSVDDKQLAALGKQFGVQYVCVAKVSKAYGSKALTVSLIEVETAEVTAISKAALSATDVSSLVSVTQKVSKEIAGKTMEEERALELQKMMPLMVYVKGNATVRDFRIGKYEVTQAQWKLVMGSNPSNFQSDDLPVENVSWNDAQEFISRLNAATGERYRLPTEAEWEYAARGGNLSRGYEYSGSNSIGEVAWYDGNSGGQTRRLPYKIGATWYNGDSGGQTHPVGAKKANELGIYDMSGNVWEWCQDCYDSNCSFRMYCGGSWNNVANFCRIATHFTGYPPDLRIHDLGFRVVLP